MKISYERKVGNITDVITFEDERGYVNHTELKELIVTVREGITEELRRREVDGCRILHQMPPLGELRRPVVKKPRRKKRNKK